jgi:hypothetical protein
MNAGSPKRKRGQALPLDTSGPVSRLLSEAELDNIESPRTKFARQFDGLDIHGSLDRLENDGTPRSSQTFDVPVQSKSELATVGQTPATPKHDRSAQAPVDGGSPKITPRSKSPPLTGEPSETFWQDSEITGHNPDDPDDDGYGINGIGFKPTAAMAWSRSQQRKQQLSDYRNREAREARQQRSERRKRLFDDGDEAPSLESSPRKAVRVHFEDG